MTVLFVFMLGAIVAQAEAQCGSTLPGTSGNLTHTEYPENYEANANCVWGTEAREPDTVFFEFEKLDVESDTNSGCAYDYVSIQFPSEDSPEKFCGRPQNRPADKVYKKNGTGDPVIKFVSDDSVQYEGFLMHYNIERYDYCQSYPCENGGSCVLDDDTEDGWICDCVSGWTGQICDEDLDECEVEPCQHGGTCTTPQFDMYQCECSPGFTGENCEIDIDECESGPCEHGGTCHDDDNSFSCACTAGFTGTTCETDINECESGPCQNGGTCNDKENGYDCSCAPGYEGAHCETDVDECSSSPCENEGTCVDEVNGYSCTCEDGYNGDHCETDIDECESDPCENGGSCEDQVDRYTCTCESGYTSVNCQIEVDECDSNPCQNGAHCVDHPNAYECICRNGYSGTHCTIDPCESKPCLNGGTCSLSDDGFECKCTNKFTGNTCENKIEEPAQPPEPQVEEEPVKEDIDEEDPCEENQCLNGGTCLPEKDDFRCFCIDGFNGKKCEIKTKDQDDTNHNRDDDDWHNQAHILASVLPSVILLILGITAALLLFAYLRKKKHNVTRVKTIKVKPAKETKPKTKTESRFEKAPKLAKIQKKIKAKAAKPKKKREHKSPAFEEDADAITVIEDDPKPRKSKKPKTRARKMSNEFKNPILLSLQQNYPSYQPMIEAPTVNDVMNTSAMQPAGMFHSLPIATYDCKPQPFQQYPARPSAVQWSNPSFNNDINSMSDEVDSADQYSDIHNGNEYSLDLFDHFESDETDNFSQITNQNFSSSSDSTTHTQPIKKYRQREMTGFDTLKSHVGSDKASYMNLHRDETIYAPTRSVAIPDKYCKQLPAKADHWQERDNKKLNKISPKHLRRDASPETLSTSEENQRHLRPSNNLPRQTGPQPESRGKGPWKEPTIVREKTVLPQNSKMQKSAASINKKSSLLSTGLRAAQPKKKSTKRITFDKNITNLTPITEEESLQFSGDDERFRRKRHPNPSIPAVRLMERHPPEGRISSCDEEGKPNKTGHHSFSQTSKAAKKDQLPRDDKMNINKSMFKLIRRPSSLNINRGRGLNRENAFIQSN
ncbi:uncharacterized protein LOC143449333 isoform X1 [Clavelina lepadiformis]|uniref:uncharacterized protein LOC143449333 isoform X1 n=1 Tax=Clavelina lepadiformis TaxID=159417 RepID=UPI00404225AE